MNAANNNLKPVTRIKLIRKDSTGVEGNIERAHDHAEALLPIIDVMKDKVEHLGFALWAQGSTMHEFITIDGDRYTLRGFKRDGSYAGVRLALRVSRSLEHRLVDVENAKEAEQLLQFMEILAIPLA
jgi:hypothetical protein